MTRVARVNMMVSLTLVIRLSIALFSFIWIIALAGYSYALPQIQDSSDSNMVVNTQTFDDNMDSVADRYVMTVNAANNTIINYTSFNILENESFVVTLPDSSSQILNRVTGPDVSNIFGGLTCNGLFVLVNTNGINIGSSARIDTGSLILSTRNITDSDFLSANYRFTKDTAKDTDRLLLNKGNITIREGGFGVLIAGAIDNQGYIIAPMGKIALLGCDAVKLDIAGHGDRKSTRLNSSHSAKSRMPSSA